jgi:hypothetical protein
MPFMKNWLALEADRSSVHGRFLQRFAVAEISEF